MKALGDEKELLTTEINLFQNMIQFNGQLLGDPDAYVEQVNGKSTGCDGDDLTN